jgi:hypothetical protein
MGTLHFKKPSKGLATFRPAPFEAGPFVVGTFVAVPFIAGPLDKFLYSCEERGKISSQESNHFSTPVTDVLRRHWRRKMSCYI